MHLSNMHSLLSRPRITQYHRTSEPTIPSPVSDPADTGRVVEIILLYTISVEFAGESEVGEGAAAGGWEGVLAFDAVEIAVEEARVAVEAEED